MIGRAPIQPRVRKLAANAMPSVVEPVTGRSTVRASE